MSSASSGDLSIAYDDAGGGEPALLFLPGWCANRTAFRDLLRATAERRRSLALDWRGHGDSDSPRGDFGLRELVDDAVSVIWASGADRIVPVALADAGWVAIELRKKLGEQIPAIVLLEWMVLGAPPPFQATLRGMQDPARWQATIRQTFDRWLNGVSNPALTHFVRAEMGQHSFGMWARAAREITQAFGEVPCPVDALGQLGIPVLHLYAQPDDPEYLAAQSAFAAEHPWFQVRRLSARSHFPMFEVPTEMVAEIETFVGGATGR